MNTEHVSLVDVEDLPELAGEVGQVVVSQPPHEIVVQSAEVSVVGSVVDVIGHQTATQKEGEEEGGRESK